MADALLQFAGRLHPMVLHLPIGVVAALLALEAIALARRDPLNRSVRVPLAWLCAATAAASVGSGLLLSNEDGYGGRTLDLHKWLGIAVAVAAMLCALSLHAPRARALYGPLLLACAALLVPASHFGAAMTHGEGYLTAPFRDRAPLQRERDGTNGRTIPTGGEYAQVIAPIFERYCASCHGESTRKGRLALHTPAAILAGGATGSAIVPGDAEDSEIVFRMRLPEDDDAAMPPRGKPRPGDDAIAAIIAWINAGASFEGEVAPPGPPRGSAPDAAGGGVMRQRDAPPPAALAALREAHAHAETIDPATGALWVSFAGAPHVGDHDAARLLAPIAPMVAELSLSRTRIGDAALDVVARMHNLRVLNLAHTRCTAEGLAGLAGLPELHSLGIAGVQVGDAAADLFAGGFTALRHVYVWESGLSPEAIARLRSSRPNLAVETGEPPPNDAVPEPPFSLSGDAPPP